MSNGSWRSLIFCVKPKEPNDLPGIGTRSGPAYHQGAQEVT